LVAYVLKNPTQILHRAHFSEKTRREETRNARYSLHCYMHQNELKILWYKTCMDQNSGTAERQQHFKGNIIWSAEFNMIKNDSHCVISQPSHTQQTLKKNS